jgi:two-component system, response regulator PdtaR
VQFQTLRRNFAFWQHFFVMANPSAAPERPLVAVIAEDESLLRALAVEVLEDEGFTTFAAENALAALDICNARPEAIDVLFTDIRMPGPIDGLQLAHRVRERWPWIGIIVASGNIFVGRDQLPEGARFLPKPYDLRRIVDVIRQMHGLR